MTIKILSFHKEKLINAMIYFIKNTNYCGTLKLFKLLNFLDFEHYRQTGRSVTGLNYDAFDMGPVPRKLWIEIKNHEELINQNFLIVEKKDIDTRELKNRELKPKHKFDDEYFSEREMEILKTLAFFFKEAKSKDMSDFSHGADLPWKEIYKNGIGKNKPIPYELGFKSAIITKMPTIDDEELKYRNEALQEIRKIKRESNA